MRRVTVRMQGRSGSAPYPRTSRRTSKKRKQHTVAEILEVHRCSSWETRHEGLARAAMPRS